MHALSTRISATVPRILRTLTHFLPGTCPSRDFMFVLPLGRAARVDGLSLKSRNA
jgi:hypothetical protein